MIETRIELPGVPADVRRLVEAADALLHDWAENSQGLKYNGVWATDGLAPVTERVRLTIRQGPDEISRSIPMSELAVPRDARDVVRDAFWDLVRKGYHRTAAALLAVCEEIRAEAASELEPVGR